MQGFYAVYRKVFEQISDEDAVFKDSKESDCERPSFGDSLSDFNEVCNSYCYCKNLRD